MRTIFAEYNPQRNSIDVYTSAGYMLRNDSVSLYLLPLHLHCKNQQIYFCLFYVLA